MTSSKRSRGRPRGSGIDDMPALTQVADLLVRERSLKATTAMKRVIQTRNDWGASDLTLLRRWQEKWSKHGAALRAAAQERARSKPAPSPVPQPSFNQRASFAGALKHMSTVDVAMVRAATAHAAAMKSVMESAAIKKWTDLNRFFDPALGIMGQDSRWKDAIAPALQFREEHRRVLETIGQQQRMWQELAQRPHVWDSFIRIFPR